MNLKEETYITKKGNVYIQGILIGNVKKEGKEKYIFFNEKIGFNSKELEEIKNALQN